MGTSRRLSLRTIAHASHSISNFSEPLYTLFAHYECLAVVLGDFASAQHLQLNHSTSAHQVLLRKGRKLSQALICLRFVQPLFVFFSVVVAPS